MVVFGIGALFLCALCVVIFHPIPDLIFYLSLSAMVGSFCYALMMWLRLHRSAEQVRSTFSQYEIPESVIHAGASVQTEHPRGISDQINAISTLRKAIVADQDVSRHQILEIGEKSDALVGHAQEALENVESLFDSVQILRHSASAQSTAALENQKAIEELQNQITSILKYSENANQLSELLGNEAQKVAISLEKTLSATRESRASQEQLARVVKVIDNIADRTNLLALNAAIEAAHAGNAGKGFAVVASQVRSLADAARNQTKEISRLMEAMLARQEANSHLIESTVIAVNNILNSMPHIGSHITQIFESAQRQAYAAKELNDIAVNFLRSAGSLSHLSTEQETMTQSLQDQFVNFKKFLAVVIKEMGASSWRDRQIWELLRDLENLENTMEN